MEIASFVVALLSFLIALGALVVSIIANGKTERNASGMMELEVRSAIADQTRYVSEVSAELGLLLDRKKAGTLTTDETTKCNVLYAKFREANQNLLNSYEEACSKYLDSKIDKIRFKRTYHHEVKNLVEAKTEALKDHLDPITTKYKCILKVYKEWNDLEN